MQVFSLIQISVLIKIRILKVKSVIPREYAVEDSYEKIVPEYNKIEVKNEPTSVLFTAFLSK